MINIGPESRDDALFEIFLSGKTDRQVLHTKKWLFSTFNKWNLWTYSTAVLNPLVHPSDQIYNRWKTARRTRALALQENDQQTSHNTRKVRPNLGSADQVCLIVFHHPLRLLHPMSSYNSIILTFEHSIWRDLELWTLEHSLWNYPMFLCLDLTSTVSMFSRNSRKHIDRLTRTCSQTNPSRSCQRNWFVVFPVSQRFVKF